MTANQKKLANAKRCTLEVLEAVFDGLLVFEMNGKYRKAFINEGLSGVRRILSIEQQAEFRRRYMELRRRGSFREKNDGREIMPSLTERGFQSLLKLKIRIANRRKDGKKTYIMYDIPERFRSRRDALRVWLKTSGFHMRQQSVWWTDRDIAEHLRNWIKIRRLDRWVEIAES